MLKYDMRTENLHAWLSSLNSVSNKTRLPSEQNLSASVLALVLKVRDRQAASARTTLRVLKRKQNFSFRIWWWEMVPDYSKERYDLKRRLEWSSKQKRKINFLYKRTQALPYHEVKGERIDIIFIFFHLN